MQAAPRDPGASKGFAQWERDGLVLEVHGPGGLLRHLVREYGRPSRDRLPATVSFSAGARGGARDGHKTTRWRLVASRPGVSPVAAGLEVRGVFGAPLVQSLVVEPLVGISAPMVDRVLLPAAAIVDRQGRTSVVLGGSGTGKTTLAIAAQLAGATLVSDDRVLVARDGSLTGWRRRLRLYADALDVHPGLRAGLASRDLGRLRLQALLRWSTRGFVNLPVAIPAVRLGRVDTVSRRRPHRVIVLERGSGSAVEDLGPSELERHCAERLTEDRARLMHLLGPEWQEAAGSSVVAESTTVAGAWRHIPALLVGVPRGGGRAMPAELVRRLELA